MMSWTDLLTALKWAFEHRKDIGQVASLAKWWRKSERPILIIGPGGVGKSTLGQFLSGRDIRWEYSESRKQEEYPLRDDPRVGVIVPPGQKHRRPAYWPDVQSGLAAGKYRGVVLVTANGYHTLGEAIDRKAHPLAAGRSKSEFVEAYLAQHREDELRILQNLAPHVRVCSRRLWVMTLVLKQDLWWAERLAVEAHYRDGAFGSELQRLADGRDARLFRTETVFASLVIRNFETATERLASNAAGYDAKEQSESVQRLRDTLSALKEWETET